MKATLCLNTFYFVLLYFIFAKQCLFKVFRTCHVTKPPTNSLANLHFYTSALPYIHTLAILNLFTSAHPRNYVSLLRLSPSPAQLSLCAFTILQYTQTQLPTSMLSLLHFVCPYLSALATSHFGTSAILRIHAICAHALSLVHASALSSLRVSTLPHLRALVPTSFHEIEPLRVHNFVPPCPHTSAQ